MGGDFILDRKGNVSFLYPSKTTRDRPTIDMLVDTLKVGLPLFYFFLIYECNG